MSKRTSVYKPTEVKLADQNGEINPQVQILRVGKFNHPQYGAFEITPKILADMKANFDSKARGIDIAFDYFHDSDQIAAGWPKSLELRENGKELWATEITWTPRAKQMLQDKELRYFSPDFAFQWTDPESGKKFHNVLFGGGLTNRPFVKGMEPIVSLGEFELANDPELQACVADLIPQLMKQGHPQEQATAIAYSKCGEKKMSDQTSRDKLHQDLQARSKQYGIEIANDANLTPPSGGPTSPDDFGDPVNFKYPMADKAHAQNARVRFKQNADEYKTEASRNKVHERIVRKELAFGVSPSFDAKDMLDAALPSDLKTKLGAKKLTETRGGTMDEKDKMIEELKRQIADLQAQLKSEKDNMGTMMQEKQKLCDEKSALETEVKTFKADKIKAEKEAKFTVMLSEGKACMAQKEAFMSGNMEEFIEKAQKINLSESGNQNGNTSGDTSDTITKIMTLAEEKAKKENMELGRAVSEILKTDKALREAYEKLN